VADFVVQEDGVKREIIKVEPSTAPMQVALLLDTSDAVRPATSDLRKGAAKFIQAVFDANPQSQIGIYTFGERPTLQVDYTSSPIALLRAAAAVFPIAGSGSYLHDAIREACTTLKKLHAARPVIVAFVDERSPEFSTYDHIRVAEFLQDARATLWTVTLQGRDLNSPAGSSTETEAQGIERSHVVDDVTVQSGGDNETVLTWTALETTFAKLATLMVAPYDITYGRPDMLIPPKRVEVKLVRPDLKLMAPRWSGK
jgi:hypothetical protein